MKALLAMLAVFSLASSGCRTGGLATEEVIATGPAGIRLAIELESGLLVAELLEVRSGGLLLNVHAAASEVPTEGPVVFLPEASIPTTLRAGTDLPGNTEKGRAVRFGREAHREWLTGLARFPYGLTPETEQRLLEAYGQSEIGRVIAGEPGGTEAFLREVEAASARFQNPDSAVRAGYRKVGPDFPGMGQHWVNPGLVLSGGVHPGRPQILTYVDVEGTPRLTGVAFAAPLAADEPPPMGPLPAELWHDHGGSLDEEALILESPHTADHDPQGPRLAMVHVWLWPDNPDGPFAQNNWALGWARRGWAPPEHVDPVVSRALFLTHGGDEYYRRLLARVVGPGTDGVIRRAVERAAGRASAAIDGLPDGAHGWSEDAEAALLDAWRGLWDDLRYEMDPALWSRLEPAHRQWGGAS